MFIADFRYPLRYPCARSLVRSSVQGDPITMTHADDREAAVVAAGGARGGGEAGDFKTFIKIEWAAPEGGSNRTGKSLVTRGCALRP